MGESLLRLLLLGGSRESGPQLRFVLTFSTDSPYALCSPPCTTISQWNRVVLLWDEDLHPRITEGFLAYWRRTVALPPFVIR
jgi:hypothetical protein